MKRLSVLMALPARMRSPCQRDVTSELGPYQETSSTHEDQTERRYTPTLNRSFHTNRTKASTLYQGWHGCGDL